MEVDQDGKPTVNGRLGGVSEVDDANRQQPQKLPIRRHPAAAERGADLRKVPSHEPAVQQSQEILEAKPAMRGLQRNTADVHVVEEVTSVVIERRAELIGQPGNTELDTILNSEILTSTKSVPGRIAKPSSLPGFESLLVLHKVGGRLGKGTLQRLEVDQTRRVRPGPRRERRCTGDWAGDRNGGRWFRLRSDEAVPSRRSSRGQAPSTAAEDSGRFRPPCP